MDNEMKKPDYKFIVGIGASAGGLEALQKLLTALPGNTGFPYIIVQHLSPDYKSMLTQILGKYTEMPVVQADEGTMVERDHVYIIQPGKMMTISGGVLHYTDQIPKELNLPIDAFFRSLAEDAGARAIAIVLSGTGSDGTNGIKTVKENDGLVIAQDLDSSKFDGMPRSALRTGLVDAQLAPEEIALELEHIAGVADIVTGRKSEQEIDAELMKRICLILKKASNINFAHYKQTTIIRRMERRMMLTHRNRLDEYVDFLFESPEEARILSKEVLIGVTSFFRDPEIFQSLKEKVIPEIIRRGTPEEPVRAWVAGCSTGEEAYSIAILFAEVMDELKIKRSVKIFATDLDTEAVETAGKGVYGDNIMNSVSPSRLSRNFTRRNNTYTINRDIRRMVVFSPHNVFQDPPFGKLDLISCRNMLIYFQPVLQNDLFAIFHLSLREGGFLFLGKSEAIGIYAEAFPPLDQLAKIFIHRRDVKVVGARKVPFLESTLIDSEFERDADVGFPRSGYRGDNGDDERSELNTALLEKYMPACIVVNEKNELVHTFGNNSNFLHIFAGKYSNDLFDLLTEALRVPVSTLLREARKKEREAQYTNIPVQGEKKSTVIDLTVAPISTGAKKGAGLYSVVFTEHGQRPESGEGSVPYDIDRVAAQRITDLEQENAAIQARLDRSVAEQECVNEELQAANEELLTANEELQSSNEELQSVNEELYTVNTEYQQRMAELNETNDDLANFLSSTQTGIIFVDNKLNIRRYTDYVTTEFSIMDHDIGRSLAFISYHFPSIDITEICTDVLKTLIPDEREVSTVKGRSFFMRVAPYRSTENRIMGCVITLMDITSRKQEQATLQNTEKQLSMAQSASDAKSSYLTRVAREIRAPMNSLIMLSKRALSSVDDRVVLTDNLERIADMVEFMTSIVTNISEASISERLAGEQLIAPFTLSSVLDGVSVIMARRAEEAGVTLDAALEGRISPRFLGNKNKVQQILVNFLINSLQNTQPGGTIRLRGREESSAGVKSVVRFTVTDNGAGISAEEQKQLFRPFGGESDESKSPLLSLGLGLSIAYNLISSMDGDVSVESGEGRGNTFTIHIKLDKYGDDGEKAQEKAEPVDYGLAGTKVLVAEDNALNRTILEAMLSNEGIDYAEAVNGRAAVDTFLREPEQTFSCVLMDMRMPELDGVRAAAEIRSSNRSDSKTIPIIGVSANGFAEDVRKAREVGFDDYLTKPIDREVLMGAMRRLIRK